jgi:opacity protein-like surface antigen
LPLDGRFVPYVGGGLGFMHADQSTAHFVNASGVRFNQAEASGDRGVALLEGGLTIAIDPSWSIIPAYRYLHAFGNPNIFGDEEAHIFKVGLRYSF